MPRKEAHRVKFQRRNVLERWAVLGWMMGLAVVLFSPIVGSGALASDTEKYDFSWLDPDKKIYVLQNRRYLKANRLQLSLMGGTGFSNPYRNTYVVDPRAAFYLTESFGFEVFYSFGFNVENNTMAALKNAAGGLNVIPAVREIQGQLGGLVHWSPWYAKINVFDQILYFDWYFAGGAGQIFSRVDTNNNAANPPSYVAQNLFALYVGTGHLFSLTENWIIRLDFLGTFYPAPSFGNTGGQTWFSNYQFNLGLGFRL